MDEPKVPAKLLTYRAEDWMGQVEPSAHFPDLRAREKWRQAQDAWAREHGLDRAGFERLYYAQRGTTRPGTPMIRRRGDE